jgi:Cu+-exporting ATPase
VVEVGSSQPDTGQIVKAGHDDVGDLVHSHAAPAMLGGEMERQRSAIDPVCGMSVDPTNSEHRSVHDGETYYFCSEGCKEGFDKDPGKYVGAAKTGRGSA